MTTMTMKTETGVRIEVDDLATHYRRDDNCEQHGAYENMACLPGAYKPELEPRWIGCPTCRDERDTQRKRRENEERERERLAERIARAGIPPRFGEATLASYVATNPGQQYAQEAAKSYAADFRLTWARGESLLLLGSVGNGKTHLAVGIAREAMEQGASAIFTTLNAMIGKVKETWGQHDGESQAKAIQRFASVDLLVVDEVGSLKCSGREWGILLAILGGRYNAMLPTIFTGNLEPAELPGYLSDQVVSRLREVGTKSVRFNWEDYRPTKAKALAGSDMSPTSAAA
jgi:DNA replication protein DnaC